MEILVSGLSPLLSVILVYIIVYSKCHRRKITLDSGFNFESSIVVYLNEIIVFQGSLIVFIIYKM